MPEGPTLVILKEAVQKYKGKKIVSTKGNSKIDQSVLVNKKILDFRTWGKQFFICVKDANVRIHFLMFGSYSLDEQIKPDKSLRLALYFSKGAIYFYTCAIKMVEDLEDAYDWKADIMSDIWDPKLARKKLKQIPDTVVADAMLDQQIFSGLGNIMKNEILYRIKLHPSTKIADIPPRKLTELVTEARNYAFDFLKWKKAFVLKKHWLAHTKKICQRCELPFTKEYIGKTKRRTFFCNNCQVKYG